MAAQTARTERRVAAPRPTSDPGRSPRQVPLEVVPSRRRHTARRRLVKYLPVAMVVVALLVVVGGQAMLANGQVRMARVDQQLQLAQSQHRQQVLAATKKETPSRIVGVAITQLHMVHPSHVTQLPYVSLKTPLPTPNVTPAGPSSSSAATASTVAQ
jgi:hypothetical protein